MGYMDSLLRPTASRERGSVSGQRGGGSLVPNWRNMLCSPCQAGLRPPNSGKISFVMHYISHGLDPYLLSVHLT